MAEMQKKEKVQKARGSIDSDNDSEWLEQLADSLEQKASRESEASSALCHICGKKCLNEISLMNHLVTHQEKRHHSHFLRHRRQHDSIKSVVCHVCSKAFASKDSLNAHLNVQNNIQIRFKCKLCPKKFIDKRNMKSHIVKCALGIGRVYTYRRRGLHSQKMSRDYNCYAEGCTLKFFSKGHLGSHLEKIHEMDITGFDLTCHVCQKLSTSSSDHLAHIKNHTCMFPCNLCQIRFKTEEVLRTHMENRHKDGEAHTFVCQEPDCIYKYKTASSLARHKSIKHSTSAPRFECDFCQRRFYKKHMLNQHMRIHSKLKPFSCWKCDYNTADSTSLRRHMRNIHDEVKIYHCKSCDEKFAFWKKWNVHEKECCSSS